MSEETEVDDDVDERPSLRSVLLQMLPIFLVLVVFGGAVIALQWYAITYHPLLFFKIVVSIFLIFVVGLVIAFFVLRKRIKPIVSELRQEANEVLNLEFEESLAPEFEDEYWVNENENVVTVKSIDRIANAYTRHRFLKAFMNSFLIWFLFFTVLGASVGSTIELFSEEEPPGLIVILIIFGVGFPIFILFFYYLFAILGVFFEYIHRRVMGLALFAGSIAIVSTYLVDLLRGGAIEQSESPYEILMWLQVMTYAALPILYFELLIIGFWQLTASDRDYLSVRGWRAPLWRINTAIRRHIGLPQFLSFVKARTGILTILYALTAILTANFFVIWYLPHQINDVFGIDRAAEITDYWGTITAIVLSVIALSLFVLGLGGRLTRMADRQAAKLYQSIRERDERPPLVFLRAFDQDKYRLKSRYGDVFARVFPTAAPKRTIDEILLENGAPYGPVIAVGDPSAPVPPLGAARIFVENEGAHWQAVVTDLAEASEIIVMCPSPSEGVRWELTLIKALEANWRTVFLARPDMDEKESLELCSMILPSTPVLPKKRKLIGFWLSTDGWQVLVSKRQSVETYTIAINMALQDLLGYEDWITQASQFAQSAFVDQVAEIREQQSEMTA